MFEDFDPESAGKKRFGASLLASVGFYGVLGTSVVLASSALHHVVEEEPAVEVTFRAPPPAPPPPPPPPPPSVTPAPAQAPARLGQARPRLEVPTEIPDATPPESEAPLAPPDSPFAPENEGDPNGTADGQIGGAPGGTGSSVAPEPAPPASAPAPTPRGPMRVPEGGTSPQPIDTSVQPEVPQELRASGLASVRIVVRVVVDEDGSVLECSVLRGHPLMPDENVTRALRSWRFSPARTASGEAFTAIHTLPITFRISL